MPSYVTGLDLGQSADFSALVTCELDYIPDPDLPGRSVLRHDVRHLHRWELGTSYPGIIADLKEWFGAGPLNGSALVIDATGVGRAVVDMIRESSIAAHVAPFSITAGLKEGTDPPTVPKKDLVASVATALQCRRLRFAEELPLRPTLERELETFRAKVTADRNETFAAWRERDHDDLVLALALAVWYGERYGSPPADFVQPAPAAPILPTWLGKLHSATGWGPGARRG
jgi:hypothetical protein